MRVPGPVAFVVGFVVVWWAAPRVFPALAGAMGAGESAPANDAETTDEPAGAQVTSSPDVVSPSPFGDPYTGAPYDTGGF